MTAAHPKRQAAWEPTGLPRRGPYATGPPGGAGIRSGLASRSLRRRFVQRFAFACGIAPEGQGYGPALQVLAALAEAAEAGAASAAPACLNRFRATRALVPPPRPADEQDCVAASRAADAALLGYAASVLARETPPRLRDPAL